VTVDGKDFGEKVGRVDEARDKDTAENSLAHPVFYPVETHVYRLGLLRSNRRDRKTDSAFLIDE
jgi:hypothetical protein